MIDPKLNFRLESCQKLLHLWQRFHGYMREMSKGGNPTPEDEAEFLKLKSEVAILHDTFFDSIPSRGREETATAQSVINVIERCILLRTIKKMSPAEVKRMEIEWHEAYLLINDTIGVLQDDVDKLAKVSQFNHSVKVFQDKGVAFVRHSVGSPKFQWAVGAAVVLAVMVIGPMMGLWSYDALNNNPSTRKVYQLVRSILRRTVAGGLDYQEWDQFIRERNDGATDRIVAMPIGYNKVQDYPLEDKQEVEREFVYKKYTNIEAFDFGNQIRSNPHTMSFKYLKGHGPIYVFITMFPNTAQAQDMIRVWEEWTRALPSGSDAIRQEGVFSYARHNNIVFGVKCEDAGERAMVMEVGLLQTRKE
ncbi:hypothetical protein JW916_08775 [Candidatus Sumerlaeota bacterium]|nr:hypothetical protein [Candidatus Sumerlaeota bacterium]